MSRMFSINIPEKNSSPLSSPYRRCGPVDAAPRCDVDAFSSRYTAPLQYIAWRKMFKHLKPGNTLL